MKEYWREVPGYDGTYQVSSLGRVKSIGRTVICSDKRKIVLNGKMLKYRDNGHGYKTVTLCANGKATSLYVHRLVEEAFIPNPHHYQEVNHKDENKGNNRADNLAWCTSKYNKNYGNRAKKFSVSRGKPVKCVETGEIYCSCGEAARHTGISSSSIWACCSGYRNTYSAGGYRWIFVDKE
jgi:galactitol-specific phosphotransferase system IIB component